MLKDVTRHDIALWHSPGIGPRTFQNLIEKYNTAEAVYFYAKQQPEQFNFSYDSLLSPQSALVEHALRWADKPNNHIIGLQYSLDYPALLSQIHSPPPILYVQGELAYLSQPCVAIIGSRNASHKGQEIAHHFATQLAQANAVITSGMAIGIDGVCHRAALAAGRPTIAVLGTGLAMNYPKRHSKLQQHIAEQGALVSEFALNQAAQANHFPRRNRIISGLSLGVLVVEAAKHSGSLITAHYAVEQNRDVFVIPSTIHDPLARGCHALIKEGAQLVENPEEIIDCLGPLERSEKIKVESAPVSLDDNPKLRKIFNSLTPGRNHPDEVIARTGLPVSEVLASLTKLELAGYITSDMFGYSQIHQQKE